MNTTPLIDVMLVLLVLLIITLPIQTHAVKLDMPAPNTTPPPIQPETVVTWAWTSTAPSPGTEPPVDRATLDSYFEDAARRRSAARNPSQSEPAGQI